LSKTFLVFEHAQNFSKENSDIFKMKTKKNIKEGELP